MMGEFTVHPLTPDRWNDLQALFGKRGACGGCWCMYWRLTRSQFEAHKGEANRQAFQAIVQANEIPGLLAYHGAQPVGWICIGPRERFPVLENSKVLARLDAQPVWSVVCFYIQSQFRNQGVALALLQVAVNFAGERGAQLVEGYPVPLKSGKIPAAFAYPGLETIFVKAGFELIERRGRSQRGIYRFSMAP